MSKQISTKTTIRNLTAEIKKTFVKKDAFTPVQTAANAAIKSLGVDGNTVNFYTSTDKSGTAAFSVDFPSELFLDQTKTTFVAKFKFDAATYPGATDPKLDGKPVMVLAVKGENPNSCTYSFLSMAALVDTYKAKAVGKDASTTVTIAGYEVDVKVNVSAAAGNALVLKDDGLYVDIGGKADKVKNAFLGLEYRCHTLMKVYSQSRDEMEKQYKAGMKSLSTYTKYRIGCAYVGEFLQTHYHVKDIALKELSLPFITDYETFLRTDKHLKINSAMVFVRNLRAMVFRAIDNEWLVKDPFRRYEYKEEETTREFLSKEEIHLLMETPITRKKMSMVRDLFLFCCFTGLAFIDLYNLKEENIKEFFDEGEWIVIHRQKTGTEANIKLLDYPKQIMEKYRGLCEDGRVFPVPNYQSCMDSLKRLGKKCGITKPLSWHVSRHSFATSVCLSNGVPIETVSSMLGHKDIKTTQVYAKITKEKLSKDVEKLSQQINNIEEFTFGNVCNDNTNTINGRV